MKIFHIVGARPNFVKMAPLYQALLSYDVVDQKIIHTGQHFDDAMYSVFFEEFGLPDPDIELGISGGSVNDQLARMITAFDPLFSSESKSVVIVYGDVTSTLAAALVCIRYSHLLVHIESGLRSFDNSMPEEINRILVDRLAHRLYVTEQSGIDNLISEGVDECKMKLIGNVMIDSLQRYLKHCKPVSDIVSALSQDAKYAVLTMHRPSNVDDPVRLKSILKGISSIAKDIMVVFPLHPRTEMNCKKYGIDLSEIKGLIVKQPLGYVDMLSLIKNSTLIFTDSGGIQEEAAALRIPCVTIRDNTERPVTINCGSNVLVSGDSDSIVKASIDALSATKSMVVPEYWDGKTAQRIAVDLIAWIESTGYSDA